MDMAARGEEGVGVAAQSEGGQVLGTEDISGKIGEGNETKQATKKQNWWEEGDDEEEDEDESLATDADDSDKHEGRFIPTGRPIAEPPIFYYDEFIDRKVPSKKRLEALFPERRDIGKRVGFRDSQTELYLLEMYFHWVVDIANHPEGCKSGKFYAGLFQELSYDMRQVEQEDHEMWMMAPSDFGKWEFSWLDQVGKTEGIEAALETGNEVFTNLEDGEEAWCKYKHLAPLRYKPDFMKSGLEKWEAIFLGNDDGTTTIQAQLSRDTDIFTT